MDEITIMRKLLSFIVFVVALLICSCNGNSCYTKLVEVDSMTENDLVDSASKVIAMIENTCKIGEGKERAYYNLLKYQLNFRHQYGKGAAS